MRKMLFFIGVTLLVVSAGCGKKVEAGTALEKAAEELAKSAPQEASAAPEGVAGAAAEGAQPETAAQPVVEPGQEMRQIVVQYKAGNLEEAVVRLQRLRRVDSLTAQQRMVLQDSVAAVMGEVYELAEKGNTKAIQAVRQFEELQNRRQ